MFAIIGDLNTLLNYQTSAQRHNIPFMLGVDGIQKIYGNNNSMMPFAITALVRNIGFSVCQSISPLKVCILKFILIYIDIDYVT